MIGKLVEHIKSIQMGEESMHDKPMIFVFAGANGSGKSTMTDLILPTLGSIRYINADNIKASSSLSDMDAAKLAESLREESLIERCNFAFETVMSTDRNLNLLKRAKKLGYFVKVVYVVTESPDINKVRVSSRADSGGHSVPEDKIVSRYYKSQSLMPEVIGVSDICHIYDNSDDRAVRIFKKRKEECFADYTSYWTKERITTLTGCRNLVEKKLNS